MKPTLLEHDQSLIDRLLEEAGTQALVVLSRHVRDPYLAPFLQGGRLGYALLIAARGRGPRLGFLSPMERDEAARSGLELLTPQQLDVHRFTRDGAEPDELWANVVERALHLCELAPGELSLAGTMPAGIMASITRRLSAAGWSFSPGEKIADRYRKKKDEHQVEAIRKASAGMMAAMGRVAEILAATETHAAGELRYQGAPLHVGDLRSAIARVLAESGLEQPEGNIVAPAEEGAVPHTVGTDGRRLRSGESLVVDIFPRGEMFSDCTRTFCVGEPTAELATGYASVLAALEMAEDRAASGISGWALHEEICAFFEEQGYRTPLSHQGTERGYVHGLGHGVGYELHELPLFREHSPEVEKRLEVGDVVTLEPGLYEPDEGWAVRLEDLYFIRGEGEEALENLTPLPRALNPKDW